MTVNCDMAAGLTGKVKASRGEALEKIPDDWGIFHPWHVKVVVRITGRQFHENCGEECGVTCQWSSGQHHPVWMDACQGGTACPDGGHVLSGCSSNPGEGSRFQDNRGVDTAPRLLRFRHCIQSRFNQKLLNNGFNVG